MRPVSFFPPPATILDCGASRTTLAVFSGRRKARPKLEKLATVVHPTGGGTETGWLEKTTAALPELVAATGAHGPVTVLLPPHLVLMKMLQTPPVAPAKRDKIIQFECQQGIPYPLAEVAWDRVVTGENMLGCHVLLCAAKLDALEPLCAAVAAAGLRPVRLLPTVQALVAGHRATIGAAGGGPVLLANLGARSAILALAEGGVYQARSLPLGGGGDYARKLALEITRTLVHFGRPVGTEPVPQVIVSGGMARAPGLTTALAEQLKMPVREWSASEAVEFGAGVSVEARAASGATLVEWMGAAELGARDEPALNLLPPRLRNQAGRRRLRPWLAVAAGLALAGLALGVRFEQSRLMARQAERATLEHELGGLRAESARVGKIRAKKAETVRRQAALEKIAKARGAWIALLAPMEQVFAADGTMWIERLELEPAEVSPEAGKAPKPLRLAMVAVMATESGAASPEGPETLRRVQRLLEQLGALPAVAAVSEVRFAPAATTLRVHFVLELKEGVL